MTNPAIPATSHDEGAAPLFYGSRLGQVAAGILRQRIGGIWPDLRRLSVLGIGFAEAFSLAVAGRGLCLRERDILPPQAGTRGGLQHRGDAAAVSRSGVRPASW